VAADPRVNARFSGIRVLEVELAAPLSGIEPITMDGGVRLGSARFLARIHGWPLGFVELPLGPRGLSAAAIAEAVQGAFGPALARHLAEDGLQADLDLERVIEGVGMVAEPACLADRRRVLAAPPSVSVVVPVVDRPKALRRCLEALIEQAYPEFEVVVVDNAPGESGAARVVRSLRSENPRIRYVTERRRGASRARNRGLHAARGEVVVFLDGDVRPDESWLAATVTALVTPVPGRDDARPPSCVTGTILPLTLDTQARLWMEEWGGYAKGFERRAFDLDENRPASPLFPYAIAMCGSGASMALRRADAIALGGFDPALGGGSLARSGEDLALLLDVVKAGGTVVYEPAAIVWHEHPATEAAFRALLHDYGIGLTGYLTRDVLRHPGDVVRIAARLPAAAAYMLRPRAGRNRRRSASFPSGTWRQELGGMLRGPAAYVAGRIRERRRRRTPARTRLARPRRAIARAGARVPWTAAAVASTGAGLLAIGLANGVSRLGNGNQALVLFWLGMVALFGPTTWRLIGRTRYFVRKRRRPRRLVAQAGGGVRGNNGRGRRSGAGSQRRPARIAAEGAARVAEVRPQQRVPLLATGGALAASSSIAMSFGNVRLGVPAPAVAARGTADALAGPATDVRRSGPTVAERLILVVVLGMALYLVKVMVNPVGFALPDEFSHLRTLADILRSTHLFADNPLLEISGIYPGLEAGAATVTVSSGVDAFPLAMVLIGGARLVGLLAMFLLAQEVTRSPVAAGLAGVIYMANPSFLAFDAAFAYESLALPLALVAIWATLRWADRGGRSALDAAVALSAIAATAVTHPLTSLALIVFLVVWGAVAFVRDRHVATIWPIWAAAAFALACGGVWLLIAGTLAISYLSTIVGGGAEQLIQILTGAGEARRLFGPRAGFVSPGPEIALTYAAVILILLSLPIFLWHAIRGWRPSAIVLTLGLAALLYPGTLALRFTTAGAETSQRASEFVFLPIAILGADWLVGRRPARLRPGRKVAFAGVLVVVAGGIIAGNPLASRLPGPYHVAAEARSIEPEGKAAATWALVHLGPDNRIVADRTNAKLMGGLGLQYPVTSANQHVGTAWPMYGVTLGQSNLDVLRQAGIEYLVVDLRLGRDVPLYPYVFEQSEPDSGNHTEPMPLAALQKWDSLPGVSRIYDSGDIIVYDIARLVDAAS